MPYIHPIYPKRTTNQGSSFCCSTGNWQMLLTLWPSLRMNCKNTQARVAQWIDPYMWRKNYDFQQCKQPCWLRIPSGNFRGLLTLSQNTRCTSYNFSRPISKMGDLLNLPSRILSRVTSTMLPQHKHQNRTKSKNSAFRSLRTTCSHAHIARAMESNGPEVRRSSRGRQGSNSKPILPPGDSWHWLWW